MSGAARVSRAAPDYFLLHASSAKTALWRRAVPVPLGLDTRPVRRTSSWCAGFSLGPRRGDRDIMGTTVYAPIESWLSDLSDAPHPYSVCRGVVQKCSALFIIVSQNAAATVAPESFQRYCGGVQLLFAKTALCCLIA